MRFNTIRFKASILFTVILAVILLAFSGLVYNKLRNILIADTDQELKLKAEEIVAILNAYEKIKTQKGQSLNVFWDILESEGFFKQQKMIIDDLWRSKLKQLELSKDYIHIMNGQGETIAYSNNLSSIVAILFRSELSVDSQRQVYRTLRKEKYNLRALNVPISYNDRIIFLQIATPLDKVNVILNRMVLGLSGMIGFILILTSFLGGLFAKRTLAPVKSATRVAQDVIRYKDLSIRVDEHQADEELQDLVNAFNHMISQLETSFGHISEFSSHVAHELKTPLAITKGELQLALSQDRDNAEYKRVIEDCLQETNRMIRVIKDLLLLAKLDYKPEIFKFERVDIHELLRELVEQCIILASEKQIKVNSAIPDEACYIKADLVHIRRLFLNLFINAIQHTPKEGLISITATVLESQIQIDVTDNGIGIDPEQLERVFDKFYRAHKNDSGTGLGLSISSSIAQAHNGSITVQSQLNRGSIFTVTLPLEK